MLTWWDLADFASSLPSDTGYRTGPTRAKRDRRTRDSAPAALCAHRSSGGLVWTTCTGMDYVLEGGGLLPCVEVQQSLPFPSSPFQPFFLSPGSGHGGCRWRQSRRGSQRCGDLGSREEPRSHCRVGDRVILTDYVGMTGPSLFHGTF